MLRKLMMVLAAVLVSASVRGDVVMVLNMNRTNYIRYEPVLATLTLRNTSGQTLVFGGEAQMKGSLEIELTDPTGKPLRGSGTKVDLRGMILRSGVDHTIQVNLSRWVNLNQIGIYKVKFIIAHPMLADEYESNACDFDVASGKVFWTRRFGVPRLDLKETTQPVKSRSYTLRALQCNGEIFYYLLVEDDVNIYAMKRIGKALGREHPQCEIDMLNRLHVLIPLKPRLFQYQVFDWNGQREINKIYKNSDRMPMLFRDSSNGEVRVLGGEEAMQGIDYKFEAEKAPGVMPTAEAGPLSAAAGTKGAEKVAPVAPKSSEKAAVAEAPASVSQSK